MGHSAVISVSQAMIWKLCFLMVNKWRYPVILSSDILIAMQTEILLKPLLSWLTPPCIHHLYGGRQQLCWTAHCKILHLPLCCTMLNDAVPFGQCPESVPWVFSVSHRCTTCQHDPVVLGDDATPSPPPIPSRYIVAVFAVEFLWYWFQWMHKDLCGHQTIKEIPKNCLCDRPPLAWSVKVEPHPWGPTHW